MRFLLVLFLGLAQSDFDESFPQTSPVIAGEEFAVPLAPSAPGDGLERLIPNQVPEIPHDNRAPEDGDLSPHQPDVFMPPDPTATDPLQNFEPSQNSPFRPHHRRQDFHRGGTQAPFVTSPGQRSQGCMPGAGGSSSCQNNPRFLAGDDFSSGPACQSCQTCPSSCQPSFCCACSPCCLSCCSLFGCWHLCNHCDPCTRKRLQAKYCYTPGDMYPRSPYFPVNHGNYYFRPYTWSHVGIQQQLASTWGADPRAPYQSQVFDSLYEEMGIPLPIIESNYEEDHIPMRDRKPSDYFTTVP